MGSYGLIGGSIIVGLALLADAPTTLKLGTGIITIYGVKFLAEKITQIMNKDASQIISLAGWCAMSLPIIGIIKISMTGFVKMHQDYMNVSNTLDKIAAWVDKVSFWN